jgi:hypothetical protein
MKQPFIHHRYHRYRYSVFRVFVHASFLLVRDREPDPRYSANSTKCPPGFCSRRLLSKIGWLAGVSVMQFRDSERVEMTSHYGADCGLYLL